jgi:hypothetical protein
MVVALVPASELSLAGALRSLTGDLSITTLILLVAGILSLLLDRKLVRSSDLQGVMLFASGGGLVFYPLALGLSSGDPYTLGYGSPILLLGLLCLSLGAVAYERSLLALCTTGAVAAFTFGIYDSTNLWDYLLDPLLTVYALGWLVVRVRRPAGSESNC